MKSPTVLSVSQLNMYIKSLIDGDHNLNTVFVVGEISNFSNHYRTGHLYMTLKDHNSLIKAVMFRSSAQRLKFIPENGLSVIVRGRVSVFERDGQYQLYIDDMQPDGMGALGLAFEQLKNKLEAQGLFDSRYKQPIPQYPQKVGVITSPTGAAVRDIFNVLARRYPSAQVVFCPVEVQGVTAAPKIADAIHRFNHINGADVLIVGRGGGSLEDLWAFNEEIVAKAVFESKIPIISAVGHETDFTICDFVADLRAPTPSAAAELAVPDQREQREYIAALKTRYTRQMSIKLSLERARLERIQSSYNFSSPVSAINQHRQFLDNLIDRIQNTINNKIIASRAQLSLSAGKLNTLSPLNVLSRGYSIVEKAGTVIRESKQVAVGDEINIRVSHGILNCEVKEIKE